MHTKCQACKLLSKANLMDFALTYWSWVTNLSWFASVFSSFSTECPQILGNPSVTGKPGQPKAFLTRWWPLVGHSHLGMRHKTLTGISVWEWGCGWWTSLQGVWGSVSFCIEGTSKCQLLGETCLGCLLSQLMIPPGSSLWIVNQVAHALGIGMSSFNMQIFA